MAKQKGRPNKYESNVKPRFDEIYEWLQVGATEAEIAENLGVNPKVFCKYKKDYAELNDLIKKGRRKPVQALKAALFKKATGFFYSESKKIISERNGITIEEYSRYSPPDPTAAMMLLKHWDNDQEWTSDPASLKLKKKELELKEKHLESEVW